MKGSRLSGLRLHAEKIAEPLLREITEIIAMPAEGIGESAACDRQPVGIEDALDAEFRPRFVKPYAEPGRKVDAAVATYAAEVRERRFPASERDFGDALKAARG